MSDIGYAEFVLSEERFLEGENAQQLVDHAAHDFHAAFTPGPDLRGNQVHDRDAEGLESSRDAEVEIGRIGENREIGFAPRGLGNQAPVAEPYTGKVGDDFDDSDYGKIFGADDGFGTGFAKVRSRTSEKDAVRPSAVEFAHQLGSVVVAGCFSGGHQDGSRGRGQTPE
jgi:hypothetical protein